MTIRTGFPQGLCSNVIQINNFEDNSIAWHYGMTGCGIASISEVALGKSKGNYITPALILPL
jgi:hypothetical protein